MKRSPLAYLLPILLLAALPGCRSTLSASDEWAAVPQILERINPPEFNDRDFDVTAFGAVEGGVEDARPGITEAIREANDAGGGRVVIPPGNWYSEGPIHLASNVNLHVSEGAVLRFSGEPADYLPAVRTRWEGTELYNYSPLIYAYQAVNVALTGGGVIEGSGGEAFAEWRPQQQAAQNRLREMGASSTPVYERQFGAGDYLRPSMIQFYSCDNVLVEDVTIHDSPMWVVHVVYSHNVTVRGITVESFRLNNDGIGVDSSVDVLIEDNSLHTGDDSIVIKSGRDQDGWRVGRPAENVVIRNNRMRGHNGLVIGSELSGGVRNVFMEANELGKVRAAIYLKSNPDRGGAIEHLRVRDINVRQADVLLRFETNYAGYRGGSNPSRYQDFLFENISAETVGTAIQAVGMQEEPITKVVVRQMTVGRAEQPMVVEHVEGLVLEDVYVNGQPLSAD
jgi:polygalacturonase